MSWLLPTADAAQEHFASHSQEAEFMKYLGEVFQVSYANTIKNSVSDYSFYILKPHIRPAQRYGLGNEVVALYAPYPEVQARSIITAGEIQQRYKERVHPVWNILITDDPDTLTHLAELTAGKDLEVYSIPFSRQELEAKPSADYIYARLEKFIHGRDLFAFQSALQSDTFFFGRRKLVDGIIGQVENGQNFGLFGLRKIGKTSVLLAVERYLDKFGTFQTIHIDCQNPANYLMKWYSLLAKICSEITGEPPVVRGEADQVAQFEKAIVDSKGKVLLVFDEIENLSFDNLSPANHWNDDFLPFWGAIRAIHQNTGGKLTFGVAGVNPRIFDIPLVAGKDNPIMLGVSPLYLWPLDAVAVREMVKTIGRYMGLSFSEDVYSWLFCQFGGHPFLVRKACSLICRKANSVSGDEVTLAEFTSRQRWLDEQLGKDILNILVVLAQHYPDEFDNLLLLASGDFDWIHRVRADAPELLTHLLEYHIVSEDAGKFRFVIEAMERFLMASGKDLKDAVKTLSASTTPTSYADLPVPEQLELWSRIGQARNSVEPRLRALLYRALVFRHGERKALQHVLEKFSTEKQRTLMGYSLAQLFSGESKALYLKDVKEIALREWDLVQHALGSDKKRFELKLDMLNSDGRADAHANPITEDVVIQIEAVAREFVTQITPYLE